MFYFSLAIEPNDLPTPTLTKSTDRRSSKLVPSEEHWQFAHKALDVRSRLPIGV